MVTFAGSTIAALHVQRENNFNLLRFLAALVVLVAHSYPLAGAAAFEPLKGRLGMSIGSIAVDVFFVSSGFLVSQSLLGSSTLSGFLLKRALRIYPALIVVALLSAYVLGPSVTTLPVGRYFAEPSTHYYFIKTASMVTGPGWTLPGVFETNPYPVFVNGSLWTLPYEIGMYAGLMALWLCVGVASRPSSRLPRFQIAIAVAVLVCVSITIAFRLRLALPPPVTHLAYMFASGSLLYLLRNRIVLSVWPVLAVAAVAVVLVAMRQTVAVQVLYTVALPYCVVLLAFVPGGAIRGFNRLGDYSYGVYVYAMPVQQLVALLYPAVTAAR